MDFARKLRAGTAGHSRAVISASVAVLVTVLSLYNVSVLPPRLRPRILQIAAASTTVLVDLKRTDILNLTPNADQLSALATQADLLGELMVTDPVLENVSRLTGIAVSRIQTDAPVTSDVPREIIEPDSGANAMDLIASPDQFKLQVQVDPTTPVIHIYAQAPSAGAAIQLANGSVQGLREYLQSLSDLRGVATPDQIRLVQLGPAAGGVVNGRAPDEIGLLAFITAFAISMIAITLIRRVKRGWQLAGARAEAT